MPRRNPAVLAVTAVALGVLAQVASVGTSLGQHIPNCNNIEIDSDGHDDNFDGGNGCDVYFGQDGRDHAQGRDGQDDLHMGSGLDEGHGNNGDDWLYGGDNGAGGHDYMFGGDGADRVQDRGDYDYDPDYACGGPENDFVATDDRDEYDYIIGAGGAHDTLARDSVESYVEQDGQC